MVFGLERKRGRLIAPMALAHPLPLTTGWGTSAETCGSGLIYIYIYIYMYIPYTSSVIGLLYNGIVIQCWRSCIPSRSTGLSLGSARFLGWMPLFVFFGLPNVSCSMMKNLILLCLWPLVFVLNNILILGIWCSTKPHLPGCFCPWTFFGNIEFNTVLTDPFMSHLATQLGFSAGEFQALQLIVLAAFGVVDQPLASCMLVHLLEIEF